MKSIFQLPLPAIRTCVRLAAIQQWRWTAQRIGAICNDGSRFSTYWRRQPFLNGRPFPNGQPFLTTTDTTVAVVDASRNLTFERCPPNVVRCLPTRPLWVATAPYYVGVGNEAQVQALDAGHCLIALTAEVFCTVKAHVYCLATTLPTFLYLSSLLWLTRDIGHEWPVILICVSGAARRASCARPTVDSGKHCRNCLTAGCASVGRACGRGCVHPTAGCLGALPLFVLRRRATRLTS